MMKMALLFETMEVDCRLPANHRDRGKKTSDLEIKNCNINHWPNISMKVMTLLFHYYVHLGFHNILFFLAAGVGLVSSS